MTQLHIVVYTVSIVVQIVVYSVKSVIDFKLSSDCCGDYLLNSNRFVTY